MISQIQIFKFHSIKLLVVEFSGDHNHCNISSVRDG